MKWMYLFFLISAFSANAIVIRHDVADKEYLQAALSDNSTVTFYGIYQEKEIVEGTGALIANDWVVTAAHVAKYLKKEGKVRFKDAFYQIDKVIGHPQWKDQQFPFDIALVKLSSPIESATIAKLYTSEDEVGKIATFVGRGDNGDGLNGITGADGQLRLAKNKVSDAQEQWLRFVFEQGDDALPLEGISGPGDSGGPAYIQVQEQLYLIGISSWQNAEATDWKEGRYGVIENYSRVSHFHKWIEATLAKESN